MRERSPSSLRNSTRTVDDEPTSAENPGAGLAQRTVTALGEKLTPVDPPTKLKVTTWDGTLVGVGAGVGVDVATCVDTAVGAGVDVGLGLLGTGVGCNAGVRVGVGFGVAACRGCGLAVSGVGSTRRRRVGVGVGRGAVDRAVGVGRVSGVAPTFGAAAGVAVTWASLLRSTTNPGLSSPSSPGEGAGLAELALNAPSSSSSSSSESLVPFSVASAGPAGSTDAIAGTAAAGADRGPITPASTRPTPWKATTTAATLATNQIDTSVTAFTGLTMAEVTPEKLKTSSNVSETSSGGHRRCQAMTEGG
jgi:hypothetical protein